MEYIPLKSFHIIKLICDRSLKHFSFNFDLLEILIKVFSLQFFLIQVFNLLHNILASHLTPRHYIFYPVDPLHDCFVTLIGQLGDGVVISQL